MAGPLSESVNTMPMYVDAVMEIVQDAGSIPAAST